MKTLTIFLYVCFINLVSALDCPPKDASVPLCPSSGSTLLDDTYPVQAFVISNKATGRHTQESSNVTLNFMETITDSYSENHYKNLPQMILSAGNEEDFNDLKTNLTKKLKDKKIPQGDIDKIMRQMTFREQQGYTWQQDYFESFFDPKTGSPVLRKVADYDNIMKGDTGKIEDMAKTGQSCGVTSGPELKGDPKSFSINGEMGGNIEAAPGGFCLVGDNQGNDYTKSFCKSDDNIIQLKTSFLSVGHVDELFKIIPTNINDGRPQECQFSLMVASPKKGIELMKKPDHGKDNIFDYNPKLSDEEIDQYFANKPSRKTAKGMCNYIKQIYKEKGASPSPSNSSPAGARSVFFNIFSLVLSDSFAGLKRNGSNNTQPDPSENICLKGMKNTTNYDLATKMTEDDNFNKLNNAIQDSLDKDAALIKDKVLSRLPQCKKYFDDNNKDVPSFIIPVPDIFSSQIDPTIINPETNKVELKKDTISTNSIYPNPTNSVIMNKTILFPNPENQAFSSYLSDEMKKRGIKYKSVSDDNINYPSTTIRITHT